MPAEVADDQGWAHARIEGVAFTCANPRCNGEALLLRAKAAPGAPAQAWEIYIELPAGFRTDERGVWQLTNKSQQRRREWKAQHRPLRADRVPAIAMPNGAHRPGPRTGTVWPGDWAQARNRQTRPPL
ncbi:MAG: hypothetical protein VW450_02270, partial [Chloroflexota bacterium]